MAKSRRRGDCQHCNGVHDIIKETITRKGIGEINRITTKDECKHCDSDGNLITIEND